MLGSVHPEGIRETQFLPCSANQSMQPRIGHGEYEQSVFNQQLAQAGQNFLWVRYVLNHIQNRNHIESATGGSGQKFFDSAGIAVDPIRGSGKLAVLRRWLHAKYRNSR